MRIGFLGSFFLVMTDGSRIFSFVPYLIDERWSVHKVDIDEPDFIVGVGL